MPAVADWSASQFDLTNPYNGTLSFNVQTTSGLYLLDQAGCSLDFEVRSTKSNVPQANGSILHHRFLTGAVMPLTIQLWEDENKPACDVVLQEMLDELSGALRSLLNAGDNEGRMAWEVAGGNERMLDDVRLLVYPSYQMGNLGVVTVTLDSRYPYAQDLLQIETPFADGVPTVLTNNGTADYDPVYKVEGPTSAFTITNATTGIQFVYDGIAIDAGDCAEIDVFGNTIYVATDCLAGDGVNLKAGVVELESDYPSLQIGPNEITIVGADMTVLWAPAWG